MWDPQETWAGGKGRLQLVLCCCTRDDPDDWVLGNSGGGPQAACLGFWQTWTVGERVLFARIGDWTQE